MSTSQQPFDAADRGPKTTPQLSDRAVNFLNRLMRERDVRISTGKVGVRVEGNRITILHRDRYETHLLLVEVEEFSDLLDAAQEVARSR